MSSSEGVGKLLLHIKHLWTCFSLGRRLDDWPLRVVCWIVIRGSTSSEGSNMGSSALCFWSSSIHFGVVSSRSSSHFGSVFMSTMPLDISINDLRSSLTSMAFVKCSSNVLNFVVHSVHTGTLRLITWTPEIDSKIGRDYKKLFTEWQLVNSRTSSWRAFLEYFDSLDRLNTAASARWQHTKHLDESIMDSKSLIYCLPFE